MKRLFRGFVFSLILLLAFPALSHALVTSPSVNVHTSSFDYKDSEAKTSFTVPENWEQVLLTAERDVVKAKFVSPDASSIIVYGSSDLWAQLSYSEKQGLSRSNIDQSYITPVEIAQSLSIPVSRVKTKTYGNIEYYVYPFSVSIDNAGMTLDASSIQALHIYNGFMFQFQYYGNETSENYNDFIKMLGSFSYDEEVKVVPVTVGTQQIYDSNGYSLTDRYIGALLLRVFITIALYTLPIVIYRYAIRKQTCDKKSAKKIVIVYGIVVFILASVVLFFITGSMASAAAVVFWSYINYKILVGNKKSQKTDDLKTSDSEANIPLEPESGSSEENQVVTVSNEIGSCVPEEIQVVSASDEIVDYIPEEKQVVSASDKISECDPEEEKVVSASNLIESDFSSSFPLYIDSYDSIRKFDSRLETDAVKNFCHICGVQLPVNAKFCNRCGTRLVSVIEE